MAWVMAPPSVCFLSFPHRHFPYLKRWRQETGEPRGCKGLSPVEEGARGLDSPCTHCETLDKLVNTTKLIIRRNFGDY